MLSQKATRLSLNDDDQITSDPALQDDTQPSPVRELPVVSQHSAGNILDGFNAATKALPPGAIIKDENFLLFDAVGSLQIMDPKMDSGLMLREQGQEAEYDVLQVLGPRQVIGIMDELLSFEMSWHQGFPLYRNLLASRYIECLLHPPPADISEASFDRDAGQTSKLNPWLNVVLRAYCIAAIKTCDFVTRRVTSQRYHEEEDFNAQTQERDLFAAFETEPIHALLTQALHFNHEANESNIDKKLLLSVKCRLEMRQYMLYAVEDTFPGEALVSSQPHWEDVYEIINVVDFTHISEQESSGSYSQELQFKIASSIPPKPLAEVSWNDTLETVRNLARSALDAYTIPKFGNFESLLTYVQLLAAQVPQPPVYVRSVMQCLIWHNGHVLGRFGYKEALFSSLQETVLPVSNVVDSRNDEVEATHDPRFKIARKLDAFAQTAADALLDMYTHQCMNRARLERDLSKAIQSWDHLEQQAEQVDEDLRPYHDFPTQVPRPTGRPVRSCPIKFWAARHKHRHMMWKVQMGFELDLYQPEELSTMYWLLSHFATAYMSLLIVTQAFNLNRLRHVPAHQASKATAINKVIERLENDIAEVKAVYHLAASLSFLYTFLTHLGFIPNPFQTAAFTTAEARYAQRIKAFLPIADPECPSLDQIAETISLDLENSQPNTFTPEDGSSNLSQRSKALALLNLTEDQVKAAKYDWAQWIKKTPAQARCEGSEGRWKKDVQAVFKSAVSLGVVCASLRKALEKLPVSNEPHIEELRGTFDVSIPSPESRWHKSWIVPQVTPKSLKNGGYNR